MGLQEIVKDIIQQHNGIARASDLVEAGISPVQTANLCEEGYIERICHGFYRLTEQEEPAEEEVLSAILPKGIVCMESALFHYGYRDFTPRKWSVAVPRTMSRCRLDTDVLMLQPYYMQVELHELGKTTDEFNGVTLPVYDRERTICDCFKYRSRMDSETFSKAVHAYAKDEKKDLRRLSMYAEKLRVRKKVEEIMEVLVNE